MIYDRTYNDIVKANLIYYEKVQKFVDLTDEETAIMERAYFNLNTLNRVTAKLLEIWQLIGNVGGAISSNNDVREWGETEIFTVSNFENIISNIALAVLQLDYFGVNTSTIQDGLNNLTTEYVYTNINTLEKLLYDIEQALTSFEQNFAYQIDDVLYIIGAKTVTQSNTDLNIK